MAWFICVAIPLIMKSLSFAQWIFAAFPVGIEARTWYVGVHWYVSVYIVKDLGMPSGPSSDGSIDMTSRDLLFLFWF